MKQIKLSIIALLAMGSLGYAGGDFSPVTEYETEDIQLAEEQYVEPVEEYVAPVEEYVEPVVEEEYVAPVAEEEYVEPAVEEEYVAPIVQEEHVAPATPTPLPVRDVSANGFYAGIGIAAAQYKPNCKCKGSRDRTAGVMAKVGYDFDKYLGIEARGMRTNWKGQEGGKVKHIGVFVKPMLPIGDSVNVYGLVGLAKTTTQGKLPKVSAETLALGAGVEVDLSEDKAKEGRYNRAFDGKGDQEKGVGVFLDYERMVVKSGAPDLDAVSAGVTYDF